MVHTVIKSVSLPYDLADFAKRNHISLSGVLQSALKNMELEANGELLESNSVLRKRLANMSDNLHKAMKFIEEKGVTDEFLEKE